MGDNLRALLNRESHADEQTPGIAFRCDQLHAR